MVWTATRALREGIGCWLGGVGTVLPSLVYQTKTEIEESVVR